MRRPPPAAAEPTEPITGAEFAGLLEPLGLFEPEPRIAVAVSGGPDSTALAFLAQRWAADHGGSVLALVVDHGLRPEAAAEATSTFTRLAERAIPSRILAWEGAKPSTGIQNAARDARMALLARACRDAGILHLLLGHQREDQAETLAIRRGHGSGLDGLAGMAAVREAKGLRLLRPLLGVPKARLVATLRAASIGWIEDPTNDDPCFDRGRLRQSTDFDRDECWESSLEHAAARAARDDRVATLLARLVRQHPLGSVRIDGTAWRQLASADRVLLLARVLTCVGGQAYPVAPTKIARLSLGAAGATRTAGGCIIVMRGDKLVICREPARVRDRIVLGPGDETVWDRRYRVSVATAPCPVEIRALGADGRTALPAATLAASRLARLPAAALEALPSAWADGRLVACPPLGALPLPLAEGFSITAALRPAYPLTAARFAGINVVSNPQPPIYRREAGSDPASEVRCVVEV